MPSNFTEHYHLSQWEAADRVKMEDFNADNARTDAAIKAEADARSAGDAALQAAVNGKASTAALNTLTQTVNGKASAAALNAAVSTINSAVAERCRMATGTYTGDGEWTLDLELGVPAKLLFITTTGTSTLQQAILLRYGTTGQPVIEYHRKVIWGETSITLEPYYTGTHPDCLTEMNDYNTNYRWIALY